MDMRDGFTWAAQRALVLGAIHFSQADGFQRADGLRWTDGFRRADGFEWTDGFRWTDGLRRPDGLRARPLIDARALISDASPNAWLASRRRDARTRAGRFAARSEVISTKR